MPAGLTQNQVIDTALQQIASQSVVEQNPQIAALAATIYAPTVQLLLRELDPDFARRTATLALSGAATPIVPWAFEYLYPGDSARLRQVRPPTSGPGALADPNDPQPVRANVAFDIISGVNTKVVLTNQQSALAVYTSTSVTETVWDAVFTDAVIRRLANPLAMAISGRPDFAKTILEQSAAMAMTAENVDDSGFRRRG